MESSILFFIVTHVLTTLKEDIFYRTKFSMKHKIPLQGWTSYKVQFFSTDLSSTFLSCFLFLRTKFNPF